MKNLNSLACLQCIKLIIYSAISRWVRILNAFTLPGNFYLFSIFLSPGNLCFNSLVSMTILQNCKMYSVSKYYLDIVLFL